MPTSNRFNFLGIESKHSGSLIQKITVDEVIDVRIEKSLKPHPIFIQGVQNITPLTQLLNQIAKDNHGINLQNFNEVNPAQNH